MNNRTEIINNEQIKRIQEMEACLDLSANAVRKLEDALADYEEAVEALERLNSYYGSSLWRADYEDDEAGKLPGDLKRGVLTEDLVYNLLTENQELVRRMIETADILKEKHIV